jgi:hypothetical protein
MAAPNHHAQNRGIVGESECGASIGATTQRERVQVEDVVEVMQPELENARAAGFAVLVDAGSPRPERTEGGTRRYSSGDLDRLRHIGDLLADGLNLAGIAVVLDLEAANEQLRAHLDDQPAPRRRHT